MTTIAQLPLEQAYLLKGRLEAEEIPAFIQGEGSTGLPSSGRLGFAVRVQVPEEHAERARAIVQEIANTQPEPDEDSEPFLSQARPFLNSTGIVMDAIGFIAAGIGAVVVLCRIFRS